MLRHLSQVSGFAAIVAAVLSISSCATGSRRPADHPADASDPYLWLEQIETPEALSWVKAHNEKSLALLTGDARYAAIHDEIHSILVAKDRIPTPIYQGGWVYNFWQDSDHVKGLWRRVRPAEFSKPDPAWETVLDIDALAKAENESWVWKGASCLAPAYEKCLISLSRGGKDAVVVREFDAAGRMFAAGGFNLPEAKSEASWMDADTLWVATDYGPGSLTSSGYPRVVKLWKRGTPLAQAEKVFEGAVEDVSAGGYSILSPDRAPVHVVYRSPSFFESEESLYSPKDGKLHKIPFPRDADFKGVFQGYALAVLRTQWGGPQEAFPAGALVSIPVSQIEADAPHLTVETVYFPDDRSTQTAISWSRDAIYLDTLQNVKGRILKVQRKKSRWSVARLPFPDNGVVSVVAADPFAREIYASYESFLVPTTLYSYSGDKAAPRAVKSLPARFDSSPYEVEQHESVSRDGVKIPYFVIHKKGMALDSNQPTLLYGYGGFEVSETPFYLGAIGKAWLDRGGVYALANIRGGGEFGPKWHEAAILQNRQVAYDDFISVAADLFRLHITLPGRLGIMGGSNGGLLMGVMFTERPDLFKAVVAQVPLLDMLRYNKLPTGAGASWVGEYGNPDDPLMRPVLAKYSPYQNMQAELHYPRVYIESSTKDDRVSPGHSRKMVARMDEQKHDVIYYENVEGGHSASADLEQRAQRSAMEYTYLWMQLGQP
jgi:prolyl oligopeptidase